MVKRLIMTQLHARDKPPVPLDRHGRPILPAKKEEVTPEPKAKPKAKAPAKKTASKKKGKK